MGILGALFGVAAMLVAAD